MPPRRIAGGRLGGSLVDGWDPARGLYEQFAGYWGLEPLLVADVAQPPVAADVLLGAERVAGSQLIKQADVLMLHHLVPDEVDARLAGRQPRLLRAAHRPRQLALPGHPRGPLRSRRPAGPSARAVPARCPARPRRPHRHHGGRPAPGHHGWASGRRSPTASSVCVHAARRSTSIRACPKPGSPSASGSGSGVTAIGVRATHDDGHASAARRPVRVRIAGAAARELHAAQGPASPSKGATDENRARCARRQRAARPVLETAARDRTSSWAPTVEAVHVHDGPVEIRRGGSPAHVDVPLRILHGPVDRVAARRPGRAVTSSRRCSALEATPGGRRPVGRTALHVLERAEQADRRRAAGGSRCRRPGPFRRLLRASRGQRAVLATGGRIAVPAPRRRDRARRPARVHQGHRAQGARSPRPGPRAVGRRVPRPLLP